MELEALAFKPLMTGLSTRTRGSRCSNWRRVVQPLRKW